MLSISAPKSILGLHKLIVQESYLEETTRVDERDNVIKTITQYRNDLIPEIVPM